MRKFPSIFDLVYTLFNNDAVLDTIKQNMDGIKYNNHLAMMRQKYLNFEFDNTIYAQVLKMLKALSNKDINKSPFNTQHWGLKQAKTQIGHYGELRHDNCLYVEEVCGGYCECSHPAILVEPVLQFWEEMLILINMMKELIGNEKTHDNDFK
jgi:hypothetical protein